MKKAVQKQLKATRLLNVIWTIATVMFLLIALFYIFQNKQRDMTDRAIGVANHISMKVDKLIDKVTQALYSTNIKEDEIVNCQQSLLPRLQHIVLNVPEITGLTIFENTTPPVICSTLPHNDPYIKLITDPRPLKIVGPVAIDDLEKPVFIIQQQLGGYYINIDMLTSYFSDFLESKIPFVNAIALYDREHHTILLESIRNKDDRTLWQITKPKERLLTPEVIESSKQRLVTRELIRISGIDIVVQIDRAQLEFIALRDAIMTDLIILFIAFGIYVFLKRLLHQHYSLHQALLYAVRENEFFGVYQPIMDRRTNTACGAEVLLRWQSSEHEVIMPDTFVHYAEQTGLIVPITLAMVKKVFAESAWFLRDNPDFHLAINLSSTHFLDTSFCHQFLKLCEKHGILPKQITLEVTERALLQHDVSVIAQMTTLREQGFSLAIDDFGTGHSNISYLQRFPFNYLKIDRLFISMIGSGAVTESLSLSIIEMANRLGLEVIAEGVETYEQVETLENHGAMLMQGWYFSKALSFPALIQFLKRTQG